MMEGTWEAPPDPALLLAIFGLRRGDGSENPTHRSRPIASCKGQVKWGKIASDDVCRRHLSSYTLQDGSAICQHPRTRSTWTSFGSWKPQ